MEQLSHETADTAVQLTKEKDKRLHGFCGWKRHITECTYKIMIDVVISVTLLHKIILYLFSRVK